MIRLGVFALLAPVCFGQAMRVVALPSQSPLVTFRIVFLTGSAEDPPDKPGLAALTAAMLAQGGTKSKSYQEIVDAFFPMATNVSAQVDKEMTTFSATTHADNLEAFYTLFRSMLLEPGWREEDLSRLRDDHINALRVGIRGNNDEELGKEVLYNTIYAGHPYGHHNLGTVSGLKRIVAADLKSFYAAQYTQANLILGVAGGAPAGFVERMTKNFRLLPSAKRSRARRLAARRPAPQAIDGLRLTLVGKPTRSVAVSFGFPIDVTRGHPDYLPLLVAQSYLGQHRNSAGRLYQRIREARGINYGDYAYIEYFPSGMFQFEPDPNLARPQQIFQIWIRPMEPPTAHFGLRLAFHELERMIKEGLTTEEFEQTREFLSKYVNLLTKTKSAELGYALDSAYYRIPDYNRYVKEGLTKLTRDQVNAAIRRHLRSDRLHVVVVTPEAEQWKNRLLGNDPSPMTYNAAKPDDIVKEDRLVEKKILAWKPDAVRVIPVDQIFE
jgi:zinc protease